MASKITSFVSLALCTLVALAVFAGMASAMSNTVTLVSQPSSVLHNAGSFQIVFNVSNDASAVTGNANFSYASTSGTSTASFSQNPANIVNGSSAIITATISFSGQQTGSIAGTITVKDTTSNGADKLLSFTVPINNTGSLTITKTQDTGKNRNGTMTLTNNGNTDLNIVLSASGEFNVSFKDGTTTINPGSSVSVAKSQTKTITIVPVNLPAFGFGAHSITVTANDSANQVQQSLSFSINEGFCTNGGSTSNLSITDIEISNSGEDDDEWKPLDEVSIEAEVKNVGSNDLNDITVELGLFNSAGDNVANDLDFTSADEEEVNLGDLDDGDDDTVRFEFRVPADMDEGNYKVVVKAFSDDHAEDLTCTDSVNTNRVEDIRIETESDEGKFIAFDNIRISPTEATCLDSVTLSFDTFNVGEDDEDQVKVNLFSRDLQVDQEVEIKQGLDRGDKQSLVMNFDVPAGLEEKSYVLELSAEYDYRNGVYREASDEATRVFLKVFGCTPTAAPASGISITASLASEAKAGQEVVVSAVIRNADTQQKIFTIDVRDYSSWAELNSVSERIFLLGAGESKTIQITLTPKSSVSGEETFTLEARSGDKVETKQVAVNVARSGFSLPGFSENKLAWIIGIINVVLIILIILVAVRLSRP